MTDQQKSKLYQSGWSKWEKFPDHLKGEYLNAPSGPGVYQLRDKKTGELVLFGRGKNVAARMTSLIPDGQGTRNNQDKKDYVRLHLDDIEYRTIPFSTENEAIEFEKYVRERERYEFPEKNSAKNK